MLTFFLITFVLFMQFVVATFTVWGVLVLPAMFCGFKIFGGDKKKNKVPFNIIIYN